MISKFFVLLLSFLFVFAFLKPIPSLANTYYFQDEFNEERSPNILDLSKWTVYKNTINGTTIQETEGNLQMSQQKNTPQFPLVVSKNVLPDSDFLVEIRLQFTNITYWGTGIALSEQAPTNGGGFNKVLTMNIWQDKSVGPNMRISFGNDISLLSNIVYTAPINTDQHTLSVERKLNNYLIYLDSRLVYVSQPTNQQLKYIWMGNPSVQNPPIPDWTSFKVDYVRVTALPRPFLDLPWDYRAQETTFNYMALNPYSWFDHQYPLQNQCCEWQVMNYTGETIKKPYRSHNGYDYSRKNGIVLNTPVLAAAAGTATFKPWNKTGGAGNMIKIDHGNGYQTWYEHLSSDNLIVSTEEQTVDVEQGQQIGLVGMTGNTDGPHIHFSVFKDSNSNGSFNDEIPYGVTDPLGWEGETVDPWSVWSNGTRSGTTNYNLFSPASFFKSINIPPTGGTLTTEDTTVSIPAGTINGSFNLVYKIGPFESLSDYVTGITPSFSLNAYSNGLPITQFSKPIRIIVNYSKANLTNIKEGTIRFRYFNEQSKSWEELPTTIDTVGKTISTEVNHLTRFIPMGEVKDLTPPSTTAIVTGEQGESNWYRTPVKIELLGQDNEEGIGLEYTLYTIDGNDWFEYTQPLVFNTDGDYQIAYQSYDKAENQEQKRTLNFHIDQTPPEVSIDTNPKIIWPPNNKLVNILLTGTFDDESQPKGQIHIEDEYNSLQPSIYDFEGLMINETIKLQAMRKEDDLDGRMYLIKVTDLAGNVGEQIQILVPHDQRN